MNIAEEEEIGGDHIDLNGMVGLDQLVPEVDHQEAEDYGEGAGDIEANAEGEEVGDVDIEVDIEPGHDEGGEGEAGVDTGGEGDASMGGDEAMPDGGEEEYEMLEDDYLPEDEEELYDERLANDETVMEEDEPLSCLISVAVLGIGLVAMGEEIGSQMSVRVFHHLVGSS